MPSDSSVKSDEEKQKSLRNLSKSGLGIQSRTVLVHAVGHDQLHQFGIDEKAAANAAALDGGQIAAAAADGVAVVRQHLLHHGPCVRAAGDRHLRGRHQIAEAHGGGLHADGNGDGALLVVHRPAAGGGIAVAIGGGDGDGIGPLVGEVGGVTELVAGLADGCGHHRTVHRHGVVVGVELLAVVAAAIHQHDEVGRFHGQTVGQTDNGAVRLHLGDDGGLAVLRRVLRAPLEVEQVLIGPGPAGGVPIVDVQLPVLAAHVHGVPAVAVLSQGEGAGAVTDTDAVDGLLTGALDQVKSEFVLLAVHRHLFERRAALGRAVVDDRVGNTGYDLEGFGVVCDGIGLLGGGRLIASLDPDRVRSGVQTGRIGIADTRQRPSVQRYGLHGVLIAVLHHTGGKGQRALRRDCREDEYLGLYAVLYDGRFSEDKMT